MRRASLLFLGLLLAACGDDSTSLGFVDRADVGGGSDAASLDDVGIVDNDAGTSDGGTSDGGIITRPDAGGGEGACDPAARDQAPASTLLLYVDGDETDRSVYDSEPTAGDEVVAGASVQLIGADGTSTTATCDDGLAAVGGLAPGAYVWDLGLDETELCRTRNCPRRFAAAVAEGRVKIVTAGDSVPVIGADRPFPDRFDDVFGELAEIESVNVAVPGSVSTDWVPGTPYFENDLGPHLEDTDVFVLSLGGNDVLQYANNAFSGGDIQGAIDGVPDFIREVQGRILQIKDEVRLANPDADLVYILYPDYGTSSVWEEQFGFALGLLGPLITDSLEQILDELSMEEDIVIADMYGYFSTTGIDPGDYMADQLHFTDAGHQILAEMIFRALGGVTVDGSSVAPEDIWVGLQP